jgi:hypothetical protein
MAAHKRIKPKPQRASKSFQRQRARSLPKLNCLSRPITTSSKLCSPIRPLSTFKLNPASKLSLKLSTGNLANTNQSNAGDLFTASNNFSNIKPEPAERRVLPLGVIVVFGLPVKATPFAASRRITECCSSEFFRERMTVFHYAIANNVLANAGRIAYLKGESNRVGILANTYGHWAGKVGLGDFFNIRNGFIAVNDYDSSFKAVVDVAEICDCLLERFRFFDLACHEKRIAGLFA